MPAATATSVQNSTVRRGAGRVPLVNPVQLSPRPGSIFGRRASPGPLERHKSLPHRPRAPILNGGVDHDEDAATRTATGLVGYAKSHPLSGHPECRDRGRQIQDPDPVAGERVRDVQESTAFRLTSADTQALMLMRCP